MPSLNPTGENRQIVQIRWQYKGIAFSVYPGITYMITENGDRILSLADQAKIDDICSKIETMQKTGLHPTDPVQARIMLGCTSRTKRDKPKRVKKEKIWSNREILTAFITYRGNQAEIGNIKRATYAKDSDFYRQMMNCSVINGDHTFSKWIDNKPGQVPYKYYKWLSQVWEWAIRRQYASFNKWQAKLDDVQKPKYRQKDLPIPIEQVMPVLDSMTKYKKFAIFLLNSGLRPGEGLALEIGDWNEDTGLLLINKAGIGVQGTKTGKDRYLPLQLDSRYSFPKKALALINEAIGDRKTLINERIWQDVPSLPAFAKELKRASKRSGLTTSAHLTPYNLRAYFSNLAALEGMEQKDIVQWMGNSEQKIAAHYQDPKYMGQALASKMI